MTTYKITTGAEHRNTSPDLRPWMALASTETYSVTAVGSRCSFTARTTDCAALEAALEADADVLEYEVVS